MREGLEDAHTKARANAVQKTQMRLSYPSKETAAGIGAELMGTFSVPIETGDPGGTRYESVSALVDTGASYTVIPATLLRQLGVEAHDRVTFILADGTQILRDVGRTWIRVREKSEVTLVVFGNDEAEALLGAYALQGLLLAVDTPNEQLVPVPGLLKQQERSASPCGV